MMRCQLGACLSADAALRRVLLLFLGVVVAGGGAARLAGRAAVDGEQRRAAGRADAVLEAG